MVRTKEEILNLVKDILKEDTSDSALSLVEDLSDTLDNVSASDETDWKTKYEENDAQWRQRYRDRFFSKPAQEEEEPVSGVTFAMTANDEPKTFSDLFKGE